MIPLRSPERSRSTLHNAPIKKTSDTEREPTALHSGTDGSMATTDPSSHNMGDSEPVKIRSMVMWKKRFLALSQNACRFELPMDMHRLETMTPLEYIQEFTVFSSKRRMLYNRVWTVHKKNDLIQFKELEKAIKEVLINTMTSEHFEEIMELLRLDSSLVVDQHTFYCLCAVCERLVFPKIKIYGPFDITEFLKEDLEAADFTALEWKLEGVKCNPDTLALLKILGVPKNTRPEEE